MKYLALLLALLCFLQYRLWFAEGSKAELARLRGEIGAQLQRNEALEARNQKLEREIMALRAGLGGVEARAREELGFIREGETYYQTVERPPPEEEEAQ